MEQRSIMLVEDNPDDEMLALHAFKKNNISNPVIVAHDGQEALDYLFNSGNPPPALILLDLKIPKISGLEVLKRVRSDPNTKLIPVIVLTSSTNDADLRASYGLGGNSYIVKSINFEKFSLEIGLFGRYWLDVNKFPPSGNKRPEEPAGQ